MSALQAFVTGQTQSAVDSRQESNELERASLERDAKFRKMQEMVSWQIRQSDSAGWFEAHRN